MLYSFEMCAGAGGEALGLEQAGFSHIGLIEIEKYACQTLKMNRPFWNVLQQDICFFNGSHLKGIELLSGGIPCPPFSIAGKRQGSDDERDLFPEAIRLVDEIRPHAVMLENVKGLLDTVFDDYRSKIMTDLNKLGYYAEWRLINASDFGVPQLRPRVVFVALKRGYEDNFEWPRPLPKNPPTVGEVLYDLMASRGWIKAKQWMNQANDIAPTLVGGSKKHGGPDLGPTRARKAWAALGVDGLGIANKAPDPDFIGMPRLTTRMTARLQGFPDEWQFSGGKTATYRQIGNAFPPPVAKAVGEKIVSCFESVAKRRLFAV